MELSSWIECISGSSISGKGKERNFPWGPIFYWWKACSELQNKYMCACPIEFGASHSLVPVESLRIGVKKHAVLAWGETYVKLVGAWQNLAVIAVTEIRDKGDQEDLMYYLRDVW